jgi:hypothetical protein
MMETILWQKEWVTNIETTKLEKAFSPKSARHQLPTQMLWRNDELQTANYANYEERMDCKASCCCGCKDDQVEARVAGGNVCWSCLSKLTIRPAVCSVARSLPAHKT